MNARSRANPGLGAIPGRQLDGVGVDLFHVDDAGVIRQVQIAGLTATQDQDLSGQLPGGLEVGGVGDDLGHSPEPDRRGQVDVGLHQHRDGAQPRQRGDGHQRAGPGLHQHADAVALAHPDLDQAAHDVVDAPVDRLVGVHASVEQQEFALRRVVRLLVDDAAQRDPGVVVDLAQSGQTRQRSDGLDGERAHGLVGCDDRVGRTAGQCQRRLGYLAQAVRQPGTECDTAVGVLGRLIGHQVDVRRLVACRRKATAPIRRRSAKSRCAALDPTTSPK